MTEQEQIEFLKERSDYHLKNLQELSRDEMLHFLPAMLANKDLAAYSAGQRDMLERLYSLVRNSNFRVEVVAHIEEPPDYWETKEALKWLDQMVICAGAENGPSIKLRAAIMAMNAAWNAAGASAYARISELRAKLAALEAQEPAITVRQKVFEDGVWLQHQKKLAAGDKLYLAAGAKESQVEQSCAGYGNHAPGDAPCNVCGFTGRKS